MMMSLIVDGCDDDDDQKKREKSRCYFYIFLYHDSVDSVHERISLKASLDLKILYDEKLKKSKVELTKW